MDTIDYAVSFYLMTETDPASET